MFVFWLVTVAAAGASVTAQQQCHNKEGVMIQPQPPFVTPSIWLPASIAWQDLPTSDVVSYSMVSSSASTTETCAEDAAAAMDSVVPFHHLKSVVIGKMPQFETKDTLQVLDVAVAAWNGGAGIWTAQYTTQQRVDAIRVFFRELSVKRQEIVTALQWEVGKNTIDAEAEFDRTVQFCEQLIDIVTTDPEFLGQWTKVPGTSVTALTKRAPIGIILALAPYNYPINESYATILPALLLGNIVILKIPTTGGLAHLLTMEAFAKALPAGAINFVSGSGRATMPPLMKTGLIDGLAFIGGSKAADELIHAHPHPHRLKVFLQLEAKNMGIMLPDIFSAPESDVLRNALDEAVLGSLSFNGQRCTALKLFFAPTQHVDSFVAKLVERIDAMTVGLPWQVHKANPAHSQITPLPHHGRIEYLESLIRDATAKGAQIMNRSGGSILGGSESTLMVPAVLYPVTPDMTIYHEEQFGPLLPVAVYDDLETVLRYGQDGQYAQQVSIFSQDADSVAVLLDRFGAVFGKLNLNAQCGRSPDTLPFSGRRSSAMGVMSVKDALREFSVPTVVAHKSEAINGKLVRGLNEKSVFLGRPRASSHSVDT